MKPQIGISPENLSQVAHLLNSLLADEFILYTKTRNAHWNIEGPDFHSKHLFFESQYQELDGVIDSVAERIRSIGHYAPATLASFLKLAHLSEQISQPNNGEGFIRELLNDHESLIMRFRGTINSIDRNLPESETKNILFRENVNSFANGLHDAGTSDFITGLLETHEKMAWMLRAHLK
jgi:starvation-inducible DNA-binding protein